MSIESKKAIKASSLQLYEDFTPKPILILFFIYMLAWFWQLGIRKAWLGAIRFEFILGAILAALAVFMLFFYQTNYRVTQKTEWPTGLLVTVGILFLCLAIQVPLSIVPEYSKEVFIERVVKFAFISIYIIAFIKNPRDLRWLVAILLIAWGYLTLESFRGAITGRMIWQNQGVPRLHGDTPMFRHPNSLAGMAMGVLPFAFFVFPLIKKKWLQVALLLSVITALACVMYAGSRTSYVGFAVLCCYLIYAINRKIIKSLVISIAVLLLVFSILPNIYQARIMTVFTGVEIEGGSMEKRTVIQEQAFAIFISNPFGVGVSAFPEARLRRFGLNQDTHNLYLEVATNLGIQGLIAFLSFISVLLATLWKVIARSEKRILWLKKILDPNNDACAENRDDIDLSVARNYLEDLYWLQGIAFAVTGYILVRIVLGVFGHDLYEIYWWLSTGFAVVLWRISTSLENKLNALPVPFTR